MELLNTYFFERGILQLIGSINFCLTSIYTCFIRITCWLCSLECLPFFVIKEVGETSTAPFMSNSSIGLTSAAAVPRFESESADILMPSPLAIRGDKTVLDHMEPHPVLCNFNQSDNATPLIASRTRPSKKSPPSNPPVIVGQLPPVPDSIPRDPVPQAGRGEGWPYAPQGWPKADDKWGWRVGKRASSNSLWIDRYVILPNSLLKSRRPGKPAEFASRRSFSEYFKQNFPEIDPDSIFKAFDWKVPAPKSTEDNEGNVHCFSVSLQLCGVHQPLLQLLDESIGL